MRQITALALILGGLTISAQAGETRVAANLRIAIDGVTRAGGTLRVGLYDEATFPVLADTPLFKRELPKIAGSVWVSFDRLPPGTYAVKVLQDVNNDGKAESGEPIGVSNGAAPENFDAAAIVLQPGPNTATVHLR